MDRAKCEMYPDRADQAERDGRLYRFGRFILEQWPHDWMVKIKDPQCREISDWGWYMTPRKCLESKMVQRFLVNYGTDEEKQHVAELLKRFEK